MEFIAHFLFAVFVGLVIFAAITFGAVMLTAVLVFAALFTVVFYLQRLWWRWRFLHGARPEPPSNTTIIEVEYKDITDK